MRDRNGFICKRPAFAPTGAAQRVRIFCAACIRMRKVCSQKYLQRRWKSFRRLRRLSWHDCCRTHISPAMNPIPRFTFRLRVRRSTLVRALASAFLISAASSSILAQNTTGDSSNRRRTGSEDNSGRRGGFNPEDAQARLLSSIRERLEVPDDEEWKIISERLGKVMELRRNTAGGSMMAFAGRGAPGGGGTDNRGGRSSRSSNPEVNLLQSAIRDKLPDAEIKTRLDRLREMRKENEAKLSKAQEDLRAVLSVRQEAVAVLFGFLP